MNVWWNKQKKRGRPKLKESKASFRISLTFKQLEIVEKSAKFMYMLTSKPKTRNDSIRFAIDKLLEPKVKRAQKIKDRYAKKQAEKNESVTNEGFKAYYLQETKKDDKALPEIETQEASV